MTTDRQYFVFELPHDRSEPFRYIGFTIPEKGWYRMWISLNGFFNRTSKKPDPSVTDRRWFSLENKTLDRVMEDTDEKCIYVGNVGTLYDFYEFIGFDRKTRKYNTGEKCMKFEDAIRKYS